MAQAGKIVAVVIALAIGATLFVPMNTAVTETSGTQDVTNESVTASLDSYVELDGYNIDQNSETVRWFNSTSDSYETLSEGTDYEIRYQSGELSVSSSSPVSDGDEVLVSYAYQPTDGTTSLVLEMLPVLVAVLLLGIAGIKAMEMM